MPSRSVADILNAVLVFFSHYDTPTAWDMEPEGPGRSQPTILGQG